MGLVPLEISAMGKALPSEPVLSSDLDSQLGKPTGYVQKRSGIVSRSLADASVLQADLAAQALHNALEKAGWNISEVDLLISASAIPVQALPCTATHILRAAQAPDGMPGFDVNLSCGSFVAALEVASGLLQVGRYRRIAIVSAELASRGLNWDDEESSYLFADGAACALVQKGDGSQGILATRLENHILEGDFCEIRAGGTRANQRAGMQEHDFYFKMQGRKVFKIASRFIDGYQEALLQQAGLGLDKVDLVIPHQASHLAMQHIHKQLGIPTHKLMDIYATHGNQVAASVPTALYEAFRQQRCKAGDVVMLIATAASVSFAGMILQL
ncbi:3-oxoacyl-[acyl-carrier-protein] synthase III C-terminal domain-containing protein [Paenalcaligenes sp. Me131]|uniref:3-oxoacyl-[acyl-carrier-protein] synthase III C-terminal domain-containing protein n=1 Tax=Paenalcaligenes sp. Me131 TaxID=3392636 RepID=UPI003D27E87D